MRNINISPEAIEAISDAVDALLAAELITKASAANITNYACLGLSLDSDLMVRPGSPEWLEGIDTGHIETVEYSEHGRGNKSILRLTMEKFSKIGDEAFFPLDGVPAESTFRVRASTIARDLRMTVSVKRARKGGVDGYVVCRCMDRPRKKSKAAPSVTNKDDGVKL